MNRRRFLHLTSLGAMTTAWTGAIWRQGLGADSAESRFPLEIERARAGGKPLLVLVVPEDEREHRVRGKLFGVFLNGAEPAAMADLALAHVVCATMAEVRGALPDAKLRGEPYLILIETEGGESVARELHPELPEYAYPAEPEKETFEERERNLEAFYDAQNAALGVCVHEALARDPARLADRAAQCAAALGEEDLILLKGLDDVATLDLGLIDRGAALLAKAAADPKEPWRAAIGAMMAAAAVRRLRETSPPGARWAVDEACGAVRIEGEDDESALLTGCGMGRVLEAGRRFLSFFAAR